MHILESPCAEFHGFDPYDDLPRPPGTNVVMIVGATATGKTELSLDLADMIRDTYGTESEVVPIDKQTTRRGLDKITAAASPDEQARVPHHMLGVDDPFDHLVPRWTYQAMARACIRDTTDRGKLAIAVGGSVHLMEALAFYPGFHSLGTESEQKRLKKLGLDDLREDAFAKGVAGPFEDNSRRWRNHIMARLAMQRPRNQPPHPGTLLLGVRRDQDVLVERIANRLDNTYWQMVAEVENWLLNGPALAPPHLREIIGFGNFWVDPDMPDETPAEIARRTKQSIFDQTVAFAEWQDLEIRTWMEPHIRWVESAEEALVLYDRHLQKLA
jgi:tRNA dimethylallyltransferase